MPNYKRKVGRIRSKKNETKVLVLKALKIYSPKWVTAVKLAEITRRSPSNITNRMRFYNNQGLVVSKKMRVKGWGNMAHWRITERGRKRLQYLTGELL